MRLCGFDVETWGEKPEYALQPNRLRTKEAWVTCAAFIVPGVRECSWRSPGVEKLRAMLKLCATQRYRIVAWNAPFDIAWLIAMGLREEAFACQWLDAMLLYKHLTISPKFDPGSKISYGLKAAVTLYLPQHAGYEQDVVFGAETEEDKQKLEAYNLDDTRRTLDLAELFLKQLSPQQRRMVLVEAACLPMVAETLVEGIAIDRAAAEALDTSLEETIDVSYAHLALHSADVTKKVLASPKQLAVLLCEKWHIPPVSYTDTGAVSTDRESLLIMATKDPRAGLVNDHREAQGNRTKFVSNTLDSLDYNGDGCVRPAHRIYGTYTGRMSISSTQGRGNGMVQTGVALHQWKRSPEFRNLIRAPAGYKLLEWDFAGQEFRWMAVVSGDEAMLSKCLPGQDAHAFMASVIDGMPYDDFMRDLAAKTPGFKEKRQLGKVGNLSCQYRTSANTLLSVAAVQHKIALTASEAQHIHTSYRATYPRVMEYWKKQCWLIKRQNFVENLAGRRVWVAPMYERERTFDWGYESTAINFPVQSMGADQKYAALLVLKDMLGRYNGRFYYELHDGVYCIVPEDKAMTALLDIKHALSNLPYDRMYGLSLPISFPVDAKIGDSWGSLKEIIE